MTQTSDVLEQLGRLVDAIESPFVHTGTWRPKHPFSIRFSDGATVDISRDDHDLTKLIERTAPAPFGDGTATRYDDTVRKARQLKAKEQPFTVPRFDPTENGILESVRMTLAPHTGKLTAYLDSVQVYGKGGHFVAHRDTPHGAQMLGTLVVCLPSPFTGGTLELARGDQRRELDWASAIAKQRHSNEVHWAAFFGDVEHAVAKVTSGDRVTVTYAIYGAGASKRPPLVQSRTSAIRTRELARTLRDALAVPTFLPEGGILMLPCLHLYRAEREQLAVRPLELEDMALLKGRDAQLARIAIEMQLETQLIYRLTDDELIDWHPLTKLPARKVFTKLDGDDTQVSPEDLEEVLDRAELLHDAGATTERYPVGKSGALDYMFRCDFSPTGYFGNEHAEAEFYAGAMLEVTIPRARDRSAPP